MAQKMIFNPNEISSPTWAGDFMGRDHLVPGGANIDPTQFKALDAVIVTADGANNAAATVLNVDALTGPIPVGTILHFGPGKFARLTSAAPAGAEALNVEALPTAIADNNQAVYAGAGKKVIRSGTAVGRTFAERANGDPFGPADPTDSEIYLVAFENPEPDRNPVVELYRHGSVVKENFLPDYNLLPTGILDAIRALYTTTEGTA
jgi:hypothetical protein